MLLEEYRKDVLESVKITAEEKKQGTVESFVEIAAENLIDIGEISEFQPCFYSGIINKKSIRVDGYYFDFFDKKLNLIISSYGGEDQIETITRTKLNNIFKQVRQFIEATRDNQLRSKVDISTPEYDLIDLIKNIHINGISKFRLLLLTDGMLSSTISTIDSTNIGEMKTEYKVWDINRFYKICRSENEVDELEVDFTELDGKGIPCLLANIVQQRNLSSYLCVMPGELLSSIYDKYGSKLLERNVRSFLSTKVAVNKKIRGTILKEPEMFFSYNNGISATATDVEVRTSSEGCYIVKVKNFQIVNGGQTTASIANAKLRDKADLSQLYVQMKLTIVDVETANKIVPDISRSSNSQNKVSDADFFSNHTFHIRYEKLSRRVFAPAVDGKQFETHWFYERARGQYLHEQMKLTPSQKDKYKLQNPKKQLITKTDLAKYVNSWRGLPWWVSKGAQANFIKFAEYIQEQWDTQDSKFNEMYFKKTIALAILFKETEMIISKQDWYENGYRANIVTYSIALLSHLLIKYYPNMMLDYTYIWNKQTLPDVLIKQMEILTREVFYSITKEDRPTVNVTQWCKRDDCWKVVKALKIELLAQIESILVEKNKIIAKEQDAIKNQNFENEVNLQFSIVEYGADNWMRVLQFGRNKGLLTSKEIEILRLLCRTDNQVIPTKYQCQILTTIRTRLGLEGFRE